MDGRRAPPWWRLQRRQATFVGLTFKLARRLTKANPAAVLETGPGRGEWVATCIVAAVALAVVIGGVGLMVARAQIEHVAVPFILLAALQLPMLWSVVRTGWPAPLDLATLHDDGRMTARKET